MTVRQRTSTYNVGYAYNLHIIFHYMFAFNLRSVTLFVRGSCMFFSLPVLSFSYGKASCVKNMQGLFCISQGDYMSELIYVVAVRDDDFEWIICSTPQTTMPTLSTIQRWINHYNDCYPHDTKRTDQFSVFSCKNTERNFDFAHDCYWHVTAHNMTKPFGRRIEGKIDYPYPAPKWTLQLESIHTH